tara:strand:+ start:250 stop:549 length:300 start_codon:yes stop_codon:yes gene_type:complete
MEELEKIRKLIGHVKQDFEMLQDGSWNFNQFAGKEFHASLDNCNKIIEIVDKLTISNLNEFRPPKHEIIVTPTPPCNTSFSLDSTGIYDDTQTLNKEIY